MIWAIGILAYLGGAFITLLLNCLVDPKSGDNGSDVPLGLFWPLAMPAILMLIFSRFARYLADRVMKR